jgi:hypothetical protein
MARKDDNAGRIGAKKESRGSTRNADRLAAFTSGSGKGKADWGACDPARIQAVLVGITQLGGAATFGLSRDLGAHSLTLLLDGNRTTLWFNGNADLDEELEGVVDTLGTLE